MMEGKDAGQGATTALGFRASSQLLVILLALVVRALPFVAWLCKGLTHPLFTLLDQHVEKLLGCVWHVGMLDSKA